MCSSKGKAWKTAGVCCLLFVTFGKGVLQGVLQERDGLKEQLANLPSYEKKSRMSMNDRMFRI